MMRFGLVGGALAAGVGIYDHLTGAGQDTRQAQLQYSLSEPILRQQRTAQALSPFATGYARVRHGDIAYGVAQKAAMADVEVMNAVKNKERKTELALLKSKITDATLGGLRDRITSATGVGVATGAASMMTRDVLKFGFGAWAGGKASDFFGLKDGSKSMMDDSMIQQSSMSMRNIREQIALKSIPVDMSSETQSITEAKLAQMSPRLKEIMNNMLANSMRDTQVARAGFMATGQYTDKKTGEIRDYSLERQERLLRRGYTEEELAGMRAGLHSSAGHAYIKYGDYAMGARAGGIGNIGELYKVGGIMGGSVDAGHDFVRNLVQKNIGRGGLDITSGSAMFGRIGNRAMELAGAGYGTGDLSSYMKNFSNLVYGSGMSTPEQQVREMQLINGTASNQGLTSGSTAPLYKAISAMASISSAGGYGALSESLQSTPIEMLRQIAGGGVISDTQKGLGMTAEIAKKFLDRSVGGGLFSEMLSTKNFDYGKGETSKYVGLLQGQYGMDYKKLLNDETAGLTGAAKARRQKQIIDYLAPAAIGGSNAIFETLVGDKGFSEINASGAHGIGPRGLQKKGLASDADEKAKDNKELGANFNMVDDAIKNRGSIVTGNEAAFGDLSKSVGKFDSSIEKVAAALDLLAKHISKVAGAPQKAR
jgi:hypothetical protein